MNPAMIGAKLLGLVLPADTARKFAPWGFGLACILALLAVWGAFKLAWPVFDWFNDREAVAEAVTKANVDALETARDADASAADQGVKDDAVLDKIHKEITDAIEDANDDGAPSAAAIAHNCERLRAYGFEGTDLPEPCRSGPVAGTETSAKP